MSASPENLDVSLTPSLIFELFKGGLAPGNPREIKDWYYDTEFKYLRQASLKAFRYAVKLTFDQAIEGEPQSYGELEEILNGYEETWLVTVDPKQAFPHDSLSTKEAWGNAVASFIPNIFALSKNKENGVLSVRLLRLQPCQVKIGTLIPSAVEVRFFF
jgi:hypothetical protein